MRKFFDSRRELVSSGPGSGGGGSSSGSSHAGGNFIGRSFAVGRHQVTVEEIIAEGENCAARGDDDDDDALFFLYPRFCFFVMRILLILERPARSSQMHDESRDRAGT